MSERTIGLYVRAGLFLGLGFLPLTGAVLAFTGDIGAGMFVIVMGATLIAIALIEALVFRRRHPLRRVP